MKVVKQAPNGYSENAGDVDDANALIAAGSDSLGEVATVAGLERALGASAWPTALVVAATALVPLVVRDWLLDTGPGRSFFDRGLHWLSVVSEFDWESFPEELIDPANVLVVAYETDRSRSNSYGLYSAREWLKRNSLLDVQLQSIFELSTSRPTDRLIAAAERHDLTALVSSSSGLAGRAIDWLLMDTADGYERTALYAAIEHQAVLLHLRALGRRTDLAVHKRAIGLAIMATGEDAAGIWQRLVWEVDKRLFVRPQALSAPGHTWLDDPRIEQSLAQAVDAVVERLAFARMVGEVMMTGALLTDLRNTLASLNHAAVLGGRGQLHVSYVATAPNDEKLNGSDVAIVVNVRASNLLHRKVSFVQIKVRRDLPGVPRWQINVKQLRDLLSTDRSATYWLLESVGSRTQIHVVPASFLSAFADSKEAHADLGKRFDINRSDIRGAAIPLPGYFVELVVGLWLGTNDKAAFEYVDSSDPRRSPAHVLTVDLRFETRIEE